MFPIYRIKPRINRVREQPYSTTKLLKLFPKVSVGLFGLRDTLWVLLDKIGEELGTIDFVGEHGGAASGEGGMAFGSRECDEFGNTSTELVHRAFSTCFDTKAEMVGVFEFAEVADAANEVVEADEGNT